MLTKPLILASTSTARKMLLERLQIPFSIENPNIDETPHDNESVEELVKRLALAKARAVASKHLNALIIGADQVAICEGVILGKPLTEETAFLYLSHVSGKKVTFLEGLCLLDSSTNHASLSVEPFDVYFRTLSPNTIKMYIQKEKPFGCAGSFKSEGLGITLVKKFAGEDPTSLIGLPLIRLTEMLLSAGMTLP